MAQYLCGLATVTSASRMAYAFARDGGLPFSSAVRWVCPRRRSPAVAIWARRRGVGPVHPAHAGLLDDHRRLHDLPLRLVRAADGAGGPGVRPDLDGDGALGPRPLVSAAGRAQRGRLRRADRDRHAAAQRAIGLGRGGVRDRAGRRVVRRRAPTVPRAASRRHSHADLSEIDPETSGGGNGMDPSRAIEPRADGDATRARCRRPDDPGARPGADAGADPGRPGRGVLPDVDLPGAAGRPRGGARRRDDRAGPRGRPGRGVRGRVGAVRGPDDGADQGGVSCCAPSWAGRSTRRRGPRSPRSARRASTSRWRSPTGSRPRPCGRRSPRSCR